MILVNENYITSSNYRLIFSKRCMMFDENNIDFELSIGKEKTKVKFSFCFEDDKTNPKASTRINDLKSDAGIGYKITLINYNTPLGTGLAKPVSIMRHEVSGKSKDIKLMVFSYKLIEAVRIIELALYEEI